MRITIAHNSVAADDAPDERDVLIQAEAVAVALAELGHDTSRLSCSLDLEAARQQLAAQKPDLVFNLIESLGGYGSLISLFPWLLGALQVPYTGSGASAMALTSNKIAAKMRMRDAGLPTPACVGPCPAEDLLAATGSFLPSKTWIIKSVWEHASIGLGADSLLTAESMATLLDEMTGRAPVLGGACFAEEFIPGREFNISLLAGTGGPAVLPPAEISFDQFGPSQPHIVDYQAKWDESSFEYQNTPRCFDFKASDQALLNELAILSRRCWEVFGLRGYARVDYRVDEDGRPWILEINANPCLSPDAGFVAALNQAGVSFPEAVAAIVADSGRRR